MFELPTVRQLPADVVATSTLIVFAMAQSAAQGTGMLTWTPSQQSPEEAMTDIRGLVSRGKPVLIGIGGSGDGGITVSNDEQVQQFCDSVRSLVGTFQFTGIDLDLETASAWTVEALVSVVRTLKQEFGTNFLVGLTVAVYGDNAVQWLALAQALGNDFDYWSPMLYDFPEAHDDRLLPVALDKVQTAVAGGVPASKQVLGFMCNAYYNSSPVSVAKQVWETVREKYPRLRGAYIWESGLELAANYAWMRQVGTLIAEG